MITRDKSGIFKSKMYNVIAEPTSHNQAIQSNECKTTMSNKYNALMKNKTWELVAKPKNKNIIGCKWTFGDKTNTNGTISKYKARLVAKGFSQQCGFDFKETFSPVVKPPSIRIVLTIAINRN